MDNTRMNSVSYDNIIVVTNGAIGDFLMAALSLDGVKKVAPASTLTIITPRSAPMLRGLLFAYPSVNVLEVNRRNFLRQFFLLFRISLGKNLVVSQVAFGKVHPSVYFLSHFLTLRLGSRCARFVEKSNEYAQKAVANTVFVEFDYQKSVYQNLTSLFNAQGINIPSEIPKYNFISDKSIAERYRLANVQYVVVHPCAFSPVRSLPVKAWAKIFEYVSENFPEMRIVVTGSNQDHFFIEKIFRDARMSATPVYLSGKLSMNELVNVIDGASGYIGVDTGISHLAGVLQKRSVIIGNLSNPCWLPRYNKNAVILTEDKNCTCDGKKGGNCFYYIGEEKYYKCMLDIPEESIYESIKNMLKK